jgi:hypothetical protein
MQAHLGEVARAEADVGPNLRGTSRDPGNLRDAWPR